MKKVSKVLVLILVTVMLLGVFSGCGAIGRNTDKYRATVAMKIGEEEITIGKLIDTFNNYYNNYSSYISQGYITADYVLQMAVSSLYSQYMKIDSYKTSNNPVSAKGDFANQEYLEEDELEYAIKYIKYILFTSLDSVVEGYIANDYELNDAEDDEDTSRDFTEYEDLSAYNTYSEYTYAQNFISEEMDEYLSKYYDGIVSGKNLDVDEYIYTSEALAQTKVDELNERIDGDEKITAAMFIDWQKQALNQYKKNVQSSYNYDVTRLLTSQVEDYITSVIVAKYNYDVYSTIDHENLAETVAELKSNYDELKKNQLAGFNVNNNYVSFIEGLSSSSYIYAVPSGYNYIFVKNILVPFTDAQQKLLSNLAKQLGSTTDERYLAARAELASQIVADDFFSEKNDDGEYSKVENMFKLDSGKLVINTANQELGQYFTADGHVVAMEGKTATETIIELMKRFNTDTAQHTAKFDYVVRVGEVPESYTAKWVTEFVDAANEAYTVAAGANGGTYGLAISTYGVHIVYFSEVVAAQTFDFDNELMKSDSAAHSMYTSYFETKSSELLEEAMEALQKLYFADKITKTSEFDKFLKSSNLTFDFEASLELDD